MRQNVVYKIKTMLEYFYFFMDRDETKYNVISSRLVALLFCSMSVSCVLLQGRRHFLKPHSRHYLEDDNKVKSQRKGPIAGVRFWEKKKEKSFSVKDPVLRYKVGTKKMSRYQIF